MKVFVQSQAFVLSVVVIIVRLSLGTCRGAENVENLMNASEIQRLVGELESGTPAQRTQAAIALHKARPQGTNVVRALIRTLKDPDSYEARTWAASALGAIGPFAQEAIDPLIDTLNDLDDTEDSLRRQSAFSLGQICEQTPTRLIESLRKSRDPFVRRGIILALHYLGPKASDATPLLIDALGADSDSSGALHMEAVHALRKVGGAAVPALVDALRTSDNSNIRRGSARVLGEIYLRGSNEAVPNEVLSALILNLRHTNDFVGWVSAEALGRIGPKTSDSIDALARVLLDHTVAPSVREAAATALGRARRGSDVLACLASALDDQNEGVRNAASDGLAQFQENALPFLVKAWAAPNSAPIGIVRTLGAIGPPARSSASILLKCLAMTESSLLMATADAMTSIGGSELTVALPRLTELLGHTNSEIRVGAARALGKLAPEAARMGQRQWAPILREATQRLGEMHTDFQNTDELRSDILRPVGDASNRLQAEVERIRAIWAAAAAAVLSLLILSLVLSVRLRRRIRVLVGQRWSLLTGTPDYVAAVENNGSGATVTVRVPGQAVPNALRTTLQLNGEWPPAREALSRIRDQIKPRSSVRVEVEDSLFARDWTQVIGSGWADVDSSIIAGQVCLTDGALRTPISASKALAFATLQCPAGPGSPEPLVATDAEVSAVRRRFQLWRGGMLRDYSPSATASDMLDALSQADIVHVCAHSTPEQIFAVDRPITVADLDERFAEGLRCRLLVLSACEAGRIDTSRSFVARLVRMNVNVLAATSPVRDHVCQSFFEEFYTALLPGRHAQGITVAEAVWKAVQACSHRFGALEAKLLGNRVDETWARTVNAFILFGDPTMQLSLRTPPKKD